MNGLLLLTIIVIVGFAAVLYLINKRLSKNTSDTTLLEWLKSMQTSLEQTNKTLNDAMRNTNQNITQVLQTNTKSLNERLDNAARVIAMVQKNVGEMSEIGRSMRELQDFLKSPKLRGNIGEQVLKQLLSQMLPKQSFHLQYTFKSGAIVDAAIKTDAGIIPVDSKFPMENFRKMHANEGEINKKQAEKLFVKDVKEHIDSIAKKYILTNEGTIDYALMYVPSEAVYYEIVNNPDMFDYASSKRVLPVSPMTFYAYLKAILMGFEGQKISQKAHEIVAGIRAIQEEYEKLGEQVNTLSRHIHNSYNTMSQLHTGFSRLGHQISSTRSLEEKEQPQLPGKD